MRRVPVRWPSRDFQTWSMAAVRMRLPLRPGLASLASALSRTARPLGWGETFRMAMPLGGLLREIGDATLFMLDAGVVAW